MDNLLTLLGLALGLVWALYYLLNQWRYMNFAHIPSKLTNNLFFGHLGYIAAEYKKAGSSTVHPGKHNGDSKCLKIVAYICRLCFGEHLERAWSPRVHVF